MQETLELTDASDDNQLLLSEVLRRVDTVHPHARVILFGSRATDQHRPDSDVDLAVITTDIPHGRATSGPLRRALWGLGVGFDLLVVTPEQWQAMLQVGNSIAAVIAAQGRVLREGH